MFLGSDLGFRVCCYMGWRVAAAWVGAVLLHGLARCFRGFRGFRKVFSRGVLDHPVQAFRGSAVRGGPSLLHGLARFAARQRPVLGSSGGPVDAERVGSSVSFLDEFDDAVVVELAERFDSATCLPDSDDGG